MECDLGRYFRLGVLVVAGRYGLLRLPSGGRYGRRVVRLRYLAERLREA